MCSLALRIFHRSIFMSSAGISRLKNCSSFRVFSTASSYSVGVVKMVTTWWAEGIQSAQRSGFSVMRRFRDINP